MTRWRWVALTIGTLAVLAACGWGVLSAVRWGFRGWGPALR